MQNVLQKLIQNSQKAIDEGVYEIAEKLQKSQMDLINLIKNNNHAPIITEVKFSSPSLGKIRTTSDPIAIANSMIRGGAVGLSVLTQPYLFDGSPEFFIKIRQNVKVPLLMKDIVIDKIQIDAAQKLGADYILLIESLFDNRYLKEIDAYVDYAHKKNLRVLIESHTKTEFENSLKTNADLIGINNRNLDTLEIDIKTTKIVLDGFDKSRIILSESGIKTPKDIQFLHDCGASAFLVGSSIMKSDNIETFVRQLVNSI
ncbi:MAG: indole-3-glycerol-phosphate synthase [Nitrosopumilaceae archaeon]|nr:indole-3-glycerol-phosphate synthase [Nitrosopumilaceae archaeon]